MKNRNRGRVFSLLTGVRSLKRAGFCVRYLPSRIRFAGLLMAVAALDVWKTLSRKDLFLVFSGLFLMLTLTVPVQAYWRGLPFMLGQGIFLHLAGILIPLLLLGIVWRFIRRKLYFEAAFVFLSALFFYAPVYVSAVGMFLLLPWILWRNVSAEIAGKRPDKVDSTI